MRYQETSGVNGDPLEQSHGGEWVFNPLEAGVASAPAQAAAEPGPWAARPGPGSPQMVLRSPYCTEFLVLLALWGPVFPARWSAGGAVQGSAWQAALRGDTLLAYRGRSWGSLHPEL